MPVCLFDWITNLLRPKVRGSQALIGHDRKSRDGPFYPS
jgi:hypothetical protein